MMTAQRVAGLPYESLPTEDGVVPTNFTYRDSDSRPPTISHHPIHMGPHYPDRSKWITCSLIIVLVVLASILGVIVGFSARRVQYDTFYNVAEKLPPAAGEGAGGRVQGSSWGEGAIGTSWEGHEGYGSSEESSEGSGEQGYNSVHSGLEESGESGSGHNAQGSGEGSVASSSGGDGSHENTVYWGPYIGPPTSSTWWWGATSAVTVANHQESVPSAPEQPPAIEIAQTDPPIIIVAITAPPAPAPVNPYVAVVPAIPAGSVDQKEPYSGTDDTDDGAIASSGNGDTNVGAIAPSGSGDTDGGAMAPSGSGDTDSGAMAPSGSGDTDGGAMAPSGSGDTNVGAIVPWGNDTDGGAMAPSGSGDTNGGAIAPLGNGDTDNGAMAPSENVFGGYNSDGYNSELGAVDYMVVMQKSLPVGLLLAILLTVILATIGSLAAIIYVVKRKTTTRRRRAHVRRAISELQAQDKLNLLESDEEEG